MLWDGNGVIRRYDTPEDIVAEFYDLRLSFYDKRRNNLIRVYAPLHYPFPDGAGP